MNVILLSGLWQWIPGRTLGPYLLRHQLAKHNITAKVIDHCQEYSSSTLIDLIETFIDETTTCLGISSTFWLDVEQKIWINNQAMPPNIYEASTYIKNKYPHIKIVVGGVGIKELNSQIEHIDAFVVGEAEDIFPELVKYWQNLGPEPKYIIHEVNKKRYYNQPINKTYQVESCDFSFTDEDAILPGETLPMETARGCIFKCKFCAFPHLGKKKFDYLKPEDRLYQQFMHNYQRWGVTNYMMTDDTFNDSEQKIDNFLEMTKKLPFKINYSAYIRADLLYSFSGQAEKLQESGLDGALFGIESLHPRASLIVGKGWSGKHAKEYVPHVIKNIWKNKVNTVIGLIAGLPEETKEDLLETSDWTNANNIACAWATLYIQNTKNVGSRTLESIKFLSEFDRNAALYGYKFDEQGHWYNKYWKLNEVGKYARFLNNRRSNETARLDPWICQQAKVLGYNMDDFINSSVRSFWFLIQPEVIIRKNKYISDYINKLKSTK